MADEGYIIAEEARNEPVLHLTCLWGAGALWEFSREVSRIAEAVPLAKSSTPDIGLATVPITPLPRPTNIPWRRGVSAIG